MKIDVSTRESRRTFYNSSKWRRLRKSILERDHYECQWCAAEGRVTTALESEDESNSNILEVDHIKELEFYPELALDSNNLRTLCKYHHNQRHNRFEHKQTKPKPGRTFREDEWWG